MAPIYNPDKFADKFKLKSSRLTNWDYSTPGYYFITICTYNHNNFFGKIIDNKMIYSKRGEIAKSELLKTFEIRKNIKLHEWVIMPNHIHILIEIIYRIDCAVETPRRDVSTNKKINQTVNAINSWKPNSISSIICQYKSICTKRIKNHNLWFSWQPRFHDQIIKNEKELFIVKNYIKNNVINWNKDKFYKK